MKLFPRCHQTSRKFSGRPQHTQKRRWETLAGRANENFINRRSQMDFAPVSFGSPFVHSSVGPAIHLPFKFRVKSFQLTPNRTHVTKLANKFQVRPNLRAFQMQMKCTRLLIGGGESGMNYVGKCPDHGIPGSLLEKIHCILLGDKFCVVIELLRDKNINSIFKSELNYYFLHKSNRNLN